jgi:hypothetical protein
MALVYRLEPGWHLTYFKIASALHHYFSIYTAYISRPGPPSVSDPSEPGHGQASKIVTPDVP